MVSVIIPSYNRYDLLLKCLESVKNQTYRDLEIIVVNDGSDDERYSILEFDPNIKYFKLPIRTGLAAKVRNYGISKSVGDWIAFLDDDDTWVPTKLSEQLEYADKYSFICSDAFYENVIMRKERELHIWNEANPTDTNELTLNILKRHNLIINSSVLIKKQLIEKIGYIPENKEYRQCEDYMAWMKVLEIENKCFFVNKPLLYYNNASHKFLWDNYIS